MLRIGAIYLILHKEKIPTEQRERIIKEIIDAHRQGGLDTQKRS